MGSWLWALLKPVWATFGVVVPGSWNRYTHPALQNSA